MPKKTSKMNITISGDALMAFRSNAGNFREAADAAMPALQNYSSDSIKVSLTSGQVNIILISIAEILVGPKYASKQGREFQGIRALQEQLVREKHRQLGNLP